MIRSTLMPLLVALSLLLPATAWAGPKVALTAIDGDEDDTVRDIVIEALESSDLSLIGKKQVNRAVDKVGDVSNLSEKDNKKLAKELSADAVITATLGKKGKNKSLKFKLFASGAMQKGFSISFKSANSAKFKKALRDKMVEKLGAVEAAEEPAEEPVATTKKGKKGKKAAVEEEPAEEPVATTKKGKKGKPVEEPAEEPAEREIASKPSREGEDGEGGSDGEEPRRGKQETAEADGDSGELETSASASPGPAPARGANRAAVRLDIGVAINKRSLTFNENLPANQEPKPFKPSAVPAAHIEAEVYPLAFSGRGLASGLGLAVEYQKTLKMNLNTSAEPGVDVPVNMNHWSVGARFRIPFGQTATSPTVTIGAGYGKQAFRPDRSGLAMAASLDLPTTDYKFIEPSLALRIPIVPLVAFVADIDGMLVTDAGPIVKADSYGQAKVYGLTAAGGLDFVFAQRFALRLVGEFQQVGFTFSGAGGMLANGRDGDPASRDVGGATDRTVGGSATLGVMY